MSRIERVSPIFPISKELPKKHPVEDFKPEEDIHTEEDSINISPEAQELVNRSTQTKLLEESERAKQLRNRLLKDI